MLSEPVGEVSGWRNKWSIGGWRWRPKPVEWGADGMRVEARVGAVHGRGGRGKLTRCEGEHGEPRSRSHVGLGGIIALVIGGAATSAASNGGLVRSRLLVGNVVVFVHAAHRACSWLLLVVCMLRGWLSTL